MCSHGTHPNTPETQYPTCSDTEHIGLPALLFTTIGYEQRTLFTSYMNIGYEQPCFSHRIWTTDNEHRSHRIWHLLFTSDNEQPCKHRIWHLLYTSVFTYCSKPCNLNWAFVCVSATVFVASPAFRGHAVWAAVAHCIRTWCLHFKRVTCLSMVRECDLLIENGTCHELGSFPSLHHCLFCWIRQQCPEKKHC